MRAEGAAPALAPLFVAIVLQLMHCESRPTLPLASDDDNEGPLDGRDFLSFFLDSAEPYESGRTTRHADFYGETPERSLATTEKLSGSPQQLENGEIDGGISQMGGMDSIESSADDKMTSQPPHSFSPRKNSPPSVVSTLISSTSDSSSVRTKMAVPAYVSSGIRPHFSSNTKTELNVQEPEPIVQHENQGGSFPANIQQLPSPFNGGFLNSSTPFHHSVIYHDNPKDPDKARSVSYSTVIQASLPALQEKASQNFHERQERNYEGSKTNFNDFGTGQGKNDTKHGTTTIAPSEINTWQAHQLQQKNNWGQSQEEIRSQQASTEANWEKQYRAPKVQQKLYGKAEQNYEVDESVSLVTNGRAHGVQSSPVPASKKDDNQKVGYVVEGRNYRKYRVEERTADGFIVGEYGVVSHDDGSLRGVRYTADGTINPKLIYDTLMKFLSL